MKFIALELQNGETQVECLERHGFTAKDFLLPMAGGAVDSQLRLFNSAALTATTNVALSTSGTAVEIDRTGIHRNAQVVAFIQLGSANRDLFIDFEICLDGTFAVPAADGVASTTNTILTIHIPSLFSGKFTRDIGLIIPWQQYTPANIQARVTCRTPAVAGAGAWGIVNVYLGYGEENVSGRKANAAETLQPDV